MISFEEALSRVEEGGRPSILLGNGFSRAYRDDIFNYANLLEAANFQGRDAELRRLFARLDTYDFEAAMRALIAARTVLESYGNHDALLAQIRTDEQLLKDALITAISVTHPDLPREVSSDQYKSVRTFLAEFDQVFTVNYDLLFYWARNMSDIPPKHYNTDDGFRKESKWQGHGTNQQAHFVHGGLHIFDSSTGIQKHTFAGSGTSIIEQVRANLNEGKFPLFVSEPTSEKKQRRIEHNPYLNYCFRALESVQGTFFVLGHSLDANDKHIFDRLRQSGVSQFFVGLFGDENSPANVQTRANAMAYLLGAGNTIDFFDVASAPVWTNET